jgi:hypothetical protein
MAEIKPLKANPLIEAWNDADDADIRAFFEHVHRTCGINDIEAYVKSTNAYKEYMLVLERKLSLEIGLDQDLPPTSKVVPIEREKPNAR